MTIKVRAWINQSYVKAVFKLWKREKTIYISTVMSKVNLEGLHAILDQLQKAGAQLGVEVHLAPTLARNTTHEQDEQGRIGTCHSRCAKNPT